MKHRPIVVNDIANLKELLSSATWSKRSDYNHIELNIDALSDKEKKYWNERLQPKLFDCGCPTGTVTLLIGATGFAYYLFFIEGIRSSGWSELLTGFLVLLISGGVGKMIGISLARVRFKKAVKQLISTLENRNDLQVMAPLI